MGKRRRAHSCPPRDAARETMGKNPTACLGRKMLGKKRATILLLAMLGSATLAAPQTAAEPVTYADAVLSDSANDAASAAEEIPTGDVREVACASGSPLDGSVRGKRSQGPGHHPSDHDYGWIRAYQTFHLFCHSDHEKSEGKGAPALWTRGFASISFCPLDSEKDCVPIDEESWSGYSVVPDDAGSLMAWVCGEWIRRVPGADEVVCDPWLESGTGYAHPTDLGGFCKLENPRCALGGTLVFRGEHTFTMEMDRGWRPVPHHACTAHGYEDCRPCLPQAATEDKTYKMWCPYAFTIPIEPYAGEADRPVRPLYECVRDPEVRNCKPAVSPDPGTMGLMERVDGEAVHVPSRPWPSSPAPPVYVGAPVTVMRSCKDWLADVVKPTPAGPAARWRR